MRTGGKRLARFVNHTTVPDGSVFAPGTRFSKVWAVRNDTNERAWPEATELIWIGGEDALLTDGAASVKVAGGLAPGAEREVSVELVAPELPGQYTTYFRLRGPQGHRFGQRLWCDIIVAVPDAEGGVGASDDDDTSSVSSSDDEEWEAVGERSEPKDEKKMTMKKDKKKQHRGGKRRARAEKALLKKRKRVETKVKKVKAKLTKLEAKLAIINAKLATTTAPAAPATPPIPSAIVVADASQDMAKLDISDEA